MFYARVRATRDDCMRTSKTVQQTGNISGGRFAVACALMRRDAHFELRFMIVRGWLTTRPKATLHAKIEIENFS